MQCANHLKQIGLAMHSLYDANRVLPPVATESNYKEVAISGPYRGVAGATVFYWLLAHMEQNAVFDRGKSAGMLKEYSSHSPVVEVRGACASVIPAYLCPSNPAVSDGRPMSQYGGAHVWGASCYAANYLVFGNPDADGWVARLQGTASFDRSIPDGLSKTILCAERYASCGRFGDRDGRFTYSSIWADSNWGFRPAFCINVDFQQPDVKGYAPCLLFQDAPHPWDSCEARRAQSPHPGSMNTLFADGSVHGIGADIDEQVWIYACDPRDGVTNEQQW